jgi:hypothetical protein
MSASGSSGESSDRLRIWVASNSVHLFRLGKLVFSLIEDFAATLEPWALFGSLSAVQR